jgi:hypothetical protein
MNLPFTVEQFLSVFEQYHQAVWPMPIALNLLGLAAVFLALRKTRELNRSIAAILSFFWFWIGIAYHFAFFAAINPAAYVFAALFVIQGVLFLVYGVFKKQLSFSFKLNTYGITGAILIVYAMIIYPLLGYALGHVYPRTPTFGLPCPTTIFTFGLLLWTDVKVPKIVLIIPFLWSIIGFTAAVNLGVLQDIGLLVAGLVGTTLVVLRDRQSVKTAGEMQR